MRAESSEESEDSEYTEEIEEIENRKEYGTCKVVKVDETFKTAVKALSLSQEEENNSLKEFSHAHKCHYDLILALLLPTLLKVEKLVLDVKIGFDKCLLERMMRRAARRENPFDSQPPFEALKVFVHSHDTEYARSTGFMTSLLKLPAIQKISAGFENTWHDDPDEVRVTDETIIELDSFSSPLTSLDLAAYALSKEDLSHILRVPKALKILSYRVCPPGSISFTDLFYALRPQRDSLESFDLDYDGDIQALYIAGAFFGPMPSLISFNTLKVFKIGTVFLEKTDNATERNRLINIFPPSLETLHLTRFHASFEGLFEGVVHLLEQKSSQQIPSLKNLILEEFQSSGVRPAKLMDMLWKGTLESAIGRLYSVAAAQDVSIELIEEPTDEESLEDEWETDEWVPEDELFDPDELEMRNWEPDVWEEVLSHFRH